METVEYRVISTKNNVNEPCEFDGSFPNRVQANDHINGNIDLMVQVAVSNDGVVFGYGGTILGAKRNLRRRTEK